MFEIVEIDVFTGSAFLMRSLKEFICLDFDVDFGGVFGFKFVHTLPFWSPRWPTWASFLKIFVRAKFVV